MSENPFQGKPIAIGRTAEVFAGEEGQVIKLFRDWVPQDWVTYEFRVARLVHSTGLPVPAVLGNIQEFKNRQAICYERVDGVTMGELIVMQPFSLFKNARLLGKLHCEMHSRKETSLPSQRRKLQNSIRNANPLPEILKLAALQSLEGFPDGDRVCHGDFHPGNIIMSPNGATIIDWTDVSSGNPHADVARTLLLIGGARLPLTSMIGWIFRLFQKSILSTYIRSYKQNSDLDVDHVKAWIPIMAAARLNEQIPEEEKRLLKIVRKEFNG